MLDALLHIVLRHYLRFDFLCNNFRIFKHYDGNIHLCQFRGGTLGGAFVPESVQIADNGSRNVQSVYGAAFDAEFNVYHVRVDNNIDIPKLRGSKYVQSRVEQTFRECKDDLNEGKLVLFTGTPCQISALGHFLRKEYDNLIKTEVVCHGVPSRMVYQHYLKERNQYLKKAALSHKKDDVYLSIITDQMVDVLIKLANKRYENKIDEARKKLDTL